MFPFCSPLPALVIPALPLVDYLPPSLVFLLTQNATQAERAQLSYKKAGSGGGRAAVQQELCRRAHTHGEPETAGPLHWDPEPQRNRKVSAEGNEKPNRRGKKTLP